MQHAAASPSPPLAGNPFVWLHVSAHDGGVKSISWQLPLLLVARARAPGWECRKLAVISALSQQIFH